MTAGKKLTREEIEKIVTKFGYYLIDIYTKLWKTRVIVEDKWGYKYDVVLRNLIETKGRLNFIDKSNPYTLENISLWLKLNRPEFELLENNIYKGVDESLIFYHHKCDEKFRLSWHSLYSGQGCGVCQGLQVGERTSLAYLIPDLAKEWHPDNELSPEYVTCGSNKNIYWICSTCGYGKNFEWFMSITSRTGKQKQGCPACAGRVVTDLNRLSIRFPEISREWDYDKNVDTPNDVSCGSHSKRYWICPNCHNSYFSEIRSRINGHDCIKCSYAEKGKLSRKSHEQFIQEIYDIVENEYSVLGIYEGNKSHISIKHNICGHIWKAEPNSFLQGTRCPKCKASKGETNINRFLNKHNILYSIEYVFDDCVYKRKLPFDFAIFDSDGILYCLIEYDGILHYEDKFDSPKEFKLTKKRDKIKTKYCQDNNINLLRIPYWEFDNIEKILEQTLFD